ncbi:hypothetical protein SAMN06269185_2335 [Natronoarchaeum philippinense]|uniref:Uncharacterized protein n=1 Tax=Natronoarchaeum philippinense TaxID=558529 RepID=A0A285NZT1_NATPI|nr:hypothetical protein [Natronoarchaeum philippinense]SNZ14975.1 hypothetical protein SAMN06269185_2335 [Natronoarchaeum philippinense]
MWFFFLLLVIGTVPVFLGLVALINRDTGDDTEEQVEELKQRVEELEAKQD